MIRYLLNFKKFINILKKLKTISEIKEESISHKNKSKNLLIKAASNPTSATNSEKNLQKRKTLKMNLEKINLILIKKSKIACKIQRI